jgi:hypothetical protein
MPTLGPASLLNPEAVVRMACPVLPWDENRIAAIGHRGRPE